MTEEQKQKYTVVMYNQPVEVELTPTQYEAWQKQRDGASSSEHFRGRKSVARVDDNGILHAPSSGSLAAATEADVSQLHRRTKAFQDQFASMSQRGSVGTSHNIEYISYEKFGALQRDFLKAREEAKSIGEAAQIAGFRPLSTYAAKLRTRSGRVVRKILQHEVGCRPNGVILILENKMPGDAHEIVVGAHTSKKTGR